MGAHGKQAWPEEGSKLCGHDKQDLWDAQDRRTEAEKAGVKPTVELNLPLSSSLILQIILEFRK